MSLTKVVSKISTNISIIKNELRKIFSTPTNARYYLALSVFLIFSVLLANIFRGHIDNPVSFSIFSILISTTGFWISLSYIFTNQHLDGLTKLPGVRIFIAAIITGLLFYAKLITIADINDVFQIDAAALPNTTYAFTYANLLLLFKWPIIILVCYIFLVIIRHTCRECIKSKKLENNTESDEDRKWLADLISTTMLIASLLALNFLLPLDVNKKESIYRFAIEYDFNSKAVCKNLTIEGHKFWAKLFIGPDQSNVLLAPKPELIYGGNAPDFAKLSAYLKTFKPIIIRCF